MAMAGCHRNFRLDADHAHRPRKLRATHTKCVAIFGTMPRATSAWESVADTASMDGRRMTGRGAWMAVGAQGRMPGATTGAAAQRPAKACQA